MKVRIAYLEEPPFYWTGPDGSATGADIELADVGVIPAQVQYHAAKSAGVSDAQLVEFKDQPEAVAALLAGKIDAFTGTALGGRVLADANKELESVTHDVSGKGNAPVGAFSFSKSNTRLLDAVNQELRRYLGSADHRARMAQYGFTSAEIDRVLSNAPSKI